jgi:cation diffusion facilitator family transporter
MNKKRGEEQQIIAAHLSIAGGIIIFLISLIVGIITDSVALLLDAATGSVILFVAFLVRLIIKKLNQPPDHLFHFGYEKYEPLTVVVQNIAIVLTCLFGIYFAIQDIIHPDNIERYDLPAMASFISAVAAVILAIYIRAAALHSHSGVLKMSASHWFIDSALSFAMCAGFLFGLRLHTLGYTHITPYVDPVMAIILALVFMRIPLKTITHNIFELLDAAPGEDIQDKIRKVVDIYKSRSLGVERIRFRKAGRKVFLDVCFFVEANLTVRQAEELANGFERDLAAQIADCDVVVYFKHI